MTPFYGVQAYGKLKYAVQGLGLESHHLFEQRFAKVLGENARQMLSIALPKAEHQAITNAWRSLIPYGENGTGKATADLVLETAKDIYKSSPTILKALGLAGAAGSANAASPNPYSSNETGSSFSTKLGTKKSGI